MTTNQTKAELLTDIRAILEDLRFQAGEGATAEGRLVALEVTSVPAGAVCRNLVVEIRPFALRADVPQADAHELISALKHEERDPNPAVREYAKRRLVHWRLPRVRTEDFEGIEIALYVTLSDSKLTLRAFTDERGWATFLNVPSDADCTMRVEPAMAITRPSAIWEMTWGLPQLMYTGMSANTRDETAERAKPQLPISGGDKNTDGELTWRIYKDDAGGFVVAFRLWRTSQRFSGGARVSFAILDAKTKTVLFEANDHMVPDHNDFLNCVVKLGRKLPFTQAYDVQCNLTPLPEANRE